MTNDVVTRAKFEGSMKPIAPPITEIKAPNKIDLPFPILLAKGHTSNIPTAVGIAPMIERVPWKVPPLAAE